jgi:hypothetical protein
VETLQDFVDAAALRFGATQETMRSASRDLLGVIKENVDLDTFNHLVDNVPGATDLIASQRVYDTDTPDLFGNRQVPPPGSSARAGGSSAGLLGLPTGSGISTSNVGTFVSMFLKFIEQKAGPELTDRVSGSLPNLKELVG